MSKAGIGVVQIDSFGNQIRAFNDGAIQAQIDRAVAGLGPEDHGAVIGVFEKTGDEAGRIRLAAVARPFGGDRFSVVGFLSHGLDQDWRTWDASAAVRFKF